MSSFYEIAPPELVDETKDEVLAALNACVVDGAHNVHLIRLPLMTFHVMQFAYDPASTDVFRYDDRLGWLLFGVRVEGWASDRIGLFREVTP